MTNEQIKNASVQDLREWFINAHKTHACCGGHTKAELNEIAMKRYEDELKSRGANVPVPTLTGGKYEGIFNGEGSI